MKFTDEQKAELETKIVETKGQLDSLVIEANRSIAHLEGKIKSLEELLTAPVLAEPEPAKDKDLSEG